jgi:hypothetical protein
MQVGEKHLPSPPFGPRSVSLGICDVRGSVIAVYMMTVALPIYPALSHRDVYQDMRSLTESSEL